MTSNTPPEPELQTTQVIGRHEKVNQVTTTKKLKELRDKRFDPVTKWKQGG